MRLRSTSAVCFAMTFGSLALIAACKTSRKKGTEDVVTPPTTGTLPDPSDPGIGGQNQQDAGKAPWASMRNDCGGIGFERHLDVNGIGSSGRLQDTYLTLNISVDQRREGAGTKGPRGDTVNDEVCLMLDRYFSNVGDVWKGAAKGNVSTGDSVSFIPDLVFDYRRSITLDISSFKPEMASPASLEATVLEASLSYYLTKGSSGVKIIPGIVMDLSCATKLKYQLYTYRSMQLPTAANQPFCKSIPADDMGNTFECLAAEPAVCPQARNLNGLCPVAPQGPTLDGCFYTVQNMPIIDFSEKTLGVATIGGRLYKTPASGSGSSGYRMTLERVEIK